MSEQEKQRVLLWLDLETTGLDPSQHVVLEIYAATANLEAPFNLMRTFHRVEHFEREAQPNAWDRVDPVVREMHEKNGLWKECESASEQITLFYDFEKWLPNPDRFEVLLAGSCPWFDRSFLLPFYGREHVDFHFSHRMYDVSAVKLFCQSLGMPKIPKGETHRARDDVFESIAHAKLCRDWLLEQGRLTASGGW